LQMILLAVLALRRWHRLARKAVVRAHCSARGDTDQATNNGRSARAERLAHYAQKESKKEITYSTLYKAKQ
jgi:hypothetical protein